MGEWTQTEAPDPQRYTSLSSDASGRIVVAAASGGQVFKSEDYGRGPWTEVTMGRRRERSLLASDFSAVATSATGQVNILVFLD